MSLLTTSEIESITGYHRDLHDTLAKTTIIVFKEPIKNITNVNTNTWAGYNNTSIEENITYTPVSGGFLARVKYNRDQKTTQIDDLNFRTLKGQVTIKVDNTAANYIKNGKNELIRIIDDTLGNLEFNVITDEAVQNFLGSKYYYFGLEKTN